MQEDFDLIAAIIEGIQEKKGRNTPMQVEAIADSVREWVEKHTGVRPFNYDGYQNAQWIIIDYGSVYVHIFVPDVRERYNLEQLWNDAKIISIPDLD